jgi:hypothetical protein
MVKSFLNRFGPDFDLFNHLLILSIGETVKSDLYNYNKQRPLDQTIYHYISLKLGSLSGHVTGQDWPYLPHIYSKAWGPDPPAKVAEQVLT